MTLVNLPIWNMCHHLPSAPFKGKIELLDIFELYRGKNTTVGDTKNTIEMNGKRYDVITGKVVGTSKVSTKTVDGFVRRKPKKTMERHSKQAASIHTKPQHAKTLMRGGLKKPSKKPSPDTINPGHGTTLVVTSASSTPSLDIKRFARAKKIPKSNLISRFSNKFQTVVQEPPTTTAHKPAKTEQSSKATSSKQRLQQSLYKAMTEAKSHEQSPHKPTKKKRRLAERLSISQRALNIGLFLIAFVLLGGFLAYQNIPNLSMRLASARSGVHGSLPGYKPSGFGLNGPIYYQPGQITLSYKSHSDERKFNIVQRNSQWNNATLLEKYVAANNRAYVTYPAEGKTVYIYDGSSASWIDQGVWYEVQGTSDLSKDQLINLANSL